MKRMWTVGIGVVGMVIGCGDSNDACTHTYAYGEEGEDYETTCEQRKESDPAERERIEAGLGESDEMAALALAPGECRNTWHIDVDGEKFERVCKDSTGNVPLTEIGQLSQSLLLGACTVADSDHTVSTLRPMVPIFRDAFDRVNELFSGDGADIRFNLSANAVRNRQATNDVIRHVVGDVHPTIPGRAGSTSCVSIGDSTDHVRCGMTVYFGTIERLAGEIGQSASEMARVTALHEFGHTFCLDHFAVDSNASVTAMNSFHLNDVSRPQLDYFRFLGSERDQVRSIVRNPD